MQWKIAYLEAFNKMEAALQIKPEQPATTKGKALPNGLTLDQQTAVKQLVKARVEALPQDKQAKAAITLWNAIKSKFGKSYKEVSPDEFGEMVSLAARVVLEGGI